MKLKMRLCGDLVLREKCDPVIEITPEIVDTLNEMVKVMDKECGAGLAAPQVGVLQRFLVVTNPDEKQIFKMINPKFISKSSTTCVMEEGCLSVLGNNDLPVYANVTRPESVEVEWLDETGQLLRAQMSGYPARIVQHEMDHLDGILFMDHLSPVRREMLMRKVKKYKK
ncbi:MAG: peptide deformylase [Rickettsiales bacterium]|jgi:peptide deformylase|nr:peptide deformylase [Rickettsiales bacterium]